MTKARELDPGESKRPKIIDLAKKDPGLIRALLDAHEKGFTCRGTWGMVVQLRILSNDIRKLATQSPQAVEESLLRAAREVDWHLADRYGKVVKTGAEADPKRGPFKIVGEVRDRGDLAPLYDVLAKADPGWEAKTRAIMDGPVKRRA